MERTGAKDLALLILRMTGLLLAFGHGWGKFSALVTGNGQWVVGIAAGLGFPAPALFGWALGITEFAGGLCLALGLGTRVAAFFIGFGMFTASFFRHGALLRLAAWLGIAHPTEERLRALGSPELALLFLAIALALMMLGPGRMSLDHRLAERRRR